MENIDRIKQKISEGRRQGLTDEQLKSRLSQEGWQVQEFEDFLLEPKRAAAPTGQTIISVRGVSKTFGKKVKALESVTVDIQAGTVTALLGPNGAGKTTLVRILATLLQPTAGTATVAGLDTVTDAQKLRSVIGLAGQYAAVDETLTGKENLEMFGRLYHLSKRAAQARADELLRQFDLEKAAGRTLKTYSGGMRRRLDLAASLVIKPKVLFLDEPTTGLDPRSRFALWNVIRDLVSDGTTVLLTTQYMEEADQLADQIFVIDRGHIITKGTPNELKRQIGGEILELHMENHDDVTKASELIKKFGKDAPHADPATGIVTLPLTGGASALVSVVRELDNAKLKLVDVMLRRPSLDDVFLKLTGHGTE
jgi:ABC-2 type transport system ATP-binding protein